MLYTLNNLGTEIIVQLKLVGLTIQSQQHILTSVDLMNICNIKTPSFFSKF